MEMSSSLVANQNVIEHRFRIRGRGRRCSRGGASSIDTFFSVRSAVLLGLVCIKPPRRSVRLCLTAHEGSAANGEAPGRFIADVSRGFLRSVLCFGWTTVDVPRRTTFFVLVESDLQTEPPSPPHTNTHTFSIYMQTHRPFYFSV